LAIDRHDPVPRCARPAPPRPGEAEVIISRHRETLRTGGFAPMGSGGKVVEKDETFISRKQGVAKKRVGFAHKNVVLTLVERDGKAHSLYVDSVRIADVVPTSRI
jgi:hypothetical protein